MRKFLVLVLFLFFISNVHACGKIPLLHKMFPILNYAVKIGIINLNGNNLIDIKRELNTLFQIHSNCPIHYCNYDNYYNINPKHVTLSKILDSIRQNRI